MDEFDVQNQVLDGLTNQFKIDFKEEFTIQLAPEGLGKVTVKFVKDADKIILNMTASSEATVILLNERLVDLQNSLRLHNAEINNIAVQKSESTSEQMMHNSLQQSFSNHHNFSGNDRNYLIMIIVKIIIIIPLRMAMKLQLRNKLKLYRVNLIQC